MGFHRFSQLEGRTLDYVPIAKQNAEGRIAADQTVTSRLLVVEALYLQRDKLNDALHEYPWAHETATSLSGMKLGGAHRRPVTEFIPDAIAERLGEVALDIIRIQAPRIFAVQELVKTAVAKRAEAGVGKNSLQIAATAAARQAGFAGTNEISLYRLRLCTACYILIDMFSGIRDSEMKSISENCISRGKSRDDSTDVIWLHGTIYKTGMRPMAWLVPPIVAEAVDVLTQLTAPLRQKLRDREAELRERIDTSVGKERIRLVKRLDMLQQQKDKLFLREGAGSIAVLSRDGINSFLTRFCADFDILGQDGEPYQLHSHQFRRTYARNVARSELGDLLTLRDHFGHWSLDMTAYYADGGADEYEVDAELLDMVTEEKLTRQNEIMGSYLDSDAPLANGDHWLKIWRSTVRTASNKEELIAGYAGSITLNGTGHSWCVGNAKGTGCGGLCVFEAQMCVDCNYGIIGQEHRPVWEGIYNQQNEVLALDDMGPSGKARAYEIQEYAGKVLRRLDGLEGHDERDA